MVELQGLEPWTSSLQSWRSSQLSYSPKKQEFVILVFYFCKTTSQLSLLV